MRYNIRRWNPFLVSIPDIGVGVFWALSGTIAPWIIYSHTQSNFLAMLLMSMGAFTGIFMQVVSGILSDRTPYTEKWGKRTPWVLGGAVVAAVTMVFWALVPNYWMLFVVAFTTYAAVNFYQGPYYTMVMEVVDPDQIGHANTLARTTAQIGATAISFVSAMIFLKFGPLVTCILIALFLLVPTFAVLPGILKERPEHFVTQTQSKFSFDFVRYPRVVQLFAATFCFFAGYGCLVPLLTPYFVNHLHFSKENAGFGMTLYAFSSIFYGIFASRVNDLFDKRKVYLISSVAFFLVFFSGNFIRQSVPAFYAFMACAGVTFLAMQIAIYTLLPEVAPRARLGEFQGLLNMFISLSQFLMMITMGEVMDRGGAAYLYPIGSLFVFLSIVIMIPDIKEMQADPQLVSE
jgi:MFS family permease